jgi:hypothetical protein
MEATTIAQGMNPHRAAVEATGFGGAARKI